MSGISPVYLGQIQECISSHFCIYYIGYILYIHVFVTLLVPNKGLKPLTLRYVTALDLSMFNGIIRTHIASLTKLDKSSSQHIPRKSGVNSNNLIKINLQQTVPKQIPNLISLNVINAQSICGPSGKTEDFIDHVTQSQVDICVVTKTFLTEQNNVTWAPSILLAMLFRINQGQMGLQEEELESSIMTLFKYPNCLMKKEDHLNFLNGMFHGTTTV